MKKKENITDAAPQDELLNTEIPDDVAQAIVGKVKSYKEKLDLEFASKSKEATEAAETEAAEALAAATEELREEFSARLISKLKEKNDHIARLEESVKRHKEQLVEKVNSFLTNSKGELRSIVEEEIRVDSETLKATRLINDIRALVGNAPVQVPVSNIDESKYNTLMEETKVLKERLELKNAANNKLKVQLKVYQLLESVPSADYEFYASQMQGVQTLVEAEEKFSRLKKAVKTSKAVDVERTVQGRGVIVEDKTSHKPRVGGSDESSIAQQRKLAGL